MKVLVLDNYDSFTYNLVQYIQEILEQKIDVFRNDEIDLDAIEAYDFIILSPGPGLPKNAGIMPALIKRYAATKTILGVCLGHQAIGEAFGASLENLAHVFHGVETPVEVVVEDEPLFSNMPRTFQAGRYHSWVVAKQDLPNELVPLAYTAEKELMAMKHRNLPIWGFQFHPEAILTHHGLKRLENFVNQL